jgi:hypothetical protein
VQDRFGADIDDHTGADVSQSPYECDARLLTDSAVTADVLPAM